MKRIIYIVFVFVILFYANAFSAQRIWNSMHGTSPVKCKPVLVSQTGNQTIISFDLPGFFTEEKNTPGGNAFSISIPGGAKMLEAGMPDLPQLAFSIIIPDGAEMKAEITSSQYTDYHLAVAPSKGNLKRDIDPSLVSYTYSSAYSTNSFYPADQVMLRDPYILRDFRGQSIVIRPVQYNPVTQTLRVYYSMKIQVNPSGNFSTKNNLNRQRPLTSVDPVFSAVYQTQFINYTNTYTPLNEHGNMLVISLASLMPTMQPFVDWKNRMGQHTVMVDVATIGTTPQAIKAYIENYYNTYGLTFVQLVGDGPDIPPFPSQYGDSDPSYGYILGNDSYAEVIVGRFSASNPAELITQVQRSMQYEMSPDVNGQWYHKGVCIGSDQGPGYNNYMDYQLENNIRTNYMGYYYTQVDELYDGSQGGVDAAGNPSPSDVVTSLNDGRSVLTYTGHGSSTSWGTSGFGTPDVSSLNNQNQLPFMWSVACVNGDFVTGTCLAEALLRATSSTGEATGALATLMSTINQSWDPPMDGEDQMVDILTEMYPGNIKHTFGGISVNGCMHMNDAYGPDGDEMTDTWTIFGDASIMVRTNTPFPLSVSNPSTIDENANTYLVNCPTNGAEVCLSHNNQIVSTGWTLVGSAILNTSGLHAGDTLDLVVTAYNAIPYFSQVVVTTASSTGITSLSQKTFSIFPNPVSGRLYLNMPVNTKDISIRVINAIGQEEFFTKCNHDGQGVFDSDFKSLPAGVYSVILSDENGFIGNEKVVVE